jgi:hypothetical protein
VIDIEAARAELLARAFGDPDGNGWLAAPGDHNAIARALSAPARRRLHEERL